MKILVTGGAGYVGSHAAKAFAQAGWDVLTVDNLSRGHRDAVRYGDLIICDICDTTAMTTHLRAFAPDIVAHFAAYAYVGESVAEPEKYYGNNTLGSLQLMEAMRQAGCRKLLFSSTCATYGIPDRVPIDELCHQDPINPYGWSKLFVERIMRDYATAHDFASIALRYFNAAGCDADGELGECHDPETHVVPLALRAALEGTAFTIFGNDYPTADGSAVRDYIHVTDLADAHVKAAERLIHEEKGFEAFNLGTGQGVSVKQLVCAVERATEKSVKIVKGARRQGDPAELVADPRRAMDALKWHPRHSAIEEIVRTALLWERRGLV